MTVAERGSWLASVRVRTTAAAVSVVALALALGAVFLVLTVRDSLRDGLETSAEQRLDAMVAQIEDSGPPAPEARDDDDDDEPDDLVWQVLDGSGKVVAESQPLGLRLAGSDEDEVRLADADHAYLVVSDDASGSDGQSYDVAVGVSLEEVDDSTSALLGPLLLGLPVLLLVVGGITWLVASRALKPVERIRREVDQITGDRLDRRVPAPRSRDEIHRLAGTMNQMLERLERTSERQRQFVGDASHELRSPLASIRQTAEVARQHPGALPEGELADSVLEEALRMQRLIEQMLALARNDGDHTGDGHRDVDLEDLVFRETRGRDGVVVDTTGVLPTRVRGSEPALAGMIRNLIDNAARHARGTVAVALREHAGAVELTVEDDGSGIAPADRERVFDRFVRLDEARSRDAGGSGLGLAIVRDVAAAHGGTVTVTDSDLGGARFVVRLPSATPKSLA